MVVPKKTDTSFEASFRSLGKATKDYTEQVGDSVEKLKKKVDRYSDAVAKGEKVDTVARLKAEKSYRAALAVRRESEQNDLRKLNMFHRLLAFGERKYDRIQKLKWFKTDLRDKRQLVDTKFGKALLKIGNSWEKFQNVKLFRVAADSYRRLKDHAMSIFEEILGPAKQVFDIAMTAGKAVFSTLSGFIPILKKVGGIFGQRKDTDEVIQATNDARDKLVEQTKGINEKLERQIAGQEHAAEQDVKMRKLAPKEAGKKGFFSSLLDGFAGFFGNIGTGLLGIFSTILGGGALLGIFMKSLGVLAAGVVGWEVGKWINEKYGKQISESIEYWENKLPGNVGRKSADDRAVETAGRWKELAEYNRELIKQGKEPIPTGVTSRVLKTGAGYNITKTAGGDVVKKEGAKAWRNNNPGNIRAGAFADSYGAIGVDEKGFAIFPDIETGRMAKEALLFGGKNYKNLKLSQAIARYAPPSENQTGIYQKTVLGAVGDIDRKMSEYSPNERKQILEAIERHEGFKIGKTTVLARGEVPFVPEPARGTIGPLAVTRGEATSLAMTGGAPTITSLERQQAVAETSVQARIQEDFFRAIREGRSSTGSGPQVVNLLQQGGGNIQNALSSDAEIPITFYPANFMLASSGNQ